jgi:hypothetical protein
MEMARRISRIAPWQAAKTLAAVYFILGLLLAVPLALFSPALSEASGEPQPGWGFFLLMPFAYACAALIFVPIGCWIYNLVAARLGGIEFSVTDTQS